ncbi:MAG: TAXI family TRAP transporter solute-binding subunit [Oscillospiraceae bacterium]|nr:TAXI family TRAP transporter solute-binding subunit [Oscillospiraceae bacterium]
MKKLLAVLLALVLVFGLVACGGGDTPTPAPPPVGGGGTTPADPPPGGTPHTERFTLSTSAPGGLWYIFGGAMSHVWGDLLPWPIDLMASSGGVENLRRAVMGDADIFFTHSSHMYEALHGIGVMDGMPPGEGTLQILTSTYPSSFYFTVLYDSDIRTLDDFAGRSVILGPPGGSVADNSRRMLQALDLYDTMQISEMGFTDAARMLQDGLVDIIGINAHPAPTITEVANMRGVYIIPFSDEEMERILAVEPFFYSDIIPANTFIGQEHDVQTPFFNIWLGVRYDVPNDVVYELLATLFSDEGMSYLLNVHHYWGYLSKRADLAEIWGFTFHPGTIEFYNDHLQYLMPRI